MTKKIGSFSLMKRMNTALLLNMIREHGPISRIELAKLTGLTAATVTNLTAELIGGDLVSECSTGVSTGGRRPVMLKVNSNGFFVASAYISPERTEFVVSDFGAEIICYKKHEYSCFSPSPEECVDFIVKSLEDFCVNNAAPIGLGIGLHGIVDSEAGVLVNAPNLRWKNVNIKALTEARTDIPIYIDNDVRLMAMAEMWFGMAKDTDDFVFLYVGRGVGGAVVMDKKLLRGSSDFAGEIGHTVIDVNGPVCECGRTGCLQAFTNKDAMLRVLRENLGKSTVLTDSSNCSDIVDAYLEGKDPSAMVVISEEIRYLSTGIVNVINVFNPKLIVLGSDIRNFDIAVLSHLADAASTAGISGRDSDCSVKYSTLGERSVLLGGIAKVLSHVYENPAMIIR